MSKNSKTMSVNHKIAACCRVADDAERVAAESYFPHRLSVIRQSKPFEMRLHALQLDPSMVGVLRHSDKIRIETDDLETSYEVNIPLTGPIVARARRHTYVAGPSTAMLFGPRGEPPCRAFEAVARSWASRSTHGRWNSSLATSWQASSARRYRRHPASTSARPGDATGGRWLGHSPSSPTGPPGWRRTRSRPVRSCRVFSSGCCSPSATRRATVCSARPRRAYVPRSTCWRTVRRSRGTVGDLAARVGASPRTIQAGFQRPVGTIPMAYLHEVRMRRVRGDLLVIDPEAATVTDIADQQGFTHPGRFAAAYREKYGVLPSKTIRSGA